MSGKRIAREKETIAKMIALYETQCPQASQEEGHYQALKRMPISAWINAFLVRKNPPVNSAPCTAISLPGAKR